MILNQNGPISINQLAIHEAMKLYEIKDRKDCFHKVLFLSDWWMKRIMEDAS